MTDERFDEPDFDDPAHAAVRDLLASARLDEPIPAEVAARLDATLAELRGSAAAQPDEPSSTVVPLRRRSRVAPRLLAAAAVIVVAGAGAVGLGQVMQDNNSSSDKAASATAAQDSGGSDQPETAPQAPASTPTATSKGLNSLGGGFSSGYRGASGVPVFTTADFAVQAGKVDLQQARRLTVTADAVRGQATRTPVPGPVAPESTSTDEDLLRDKVAAGLRARACIPPQIDGTKSFPIILDSQPAVLVVHPANAGTRLVEAWSCDGSKVLAFAQVPD